MSGEKKGSDHTMIFVFFSELGNKNTSSFYNSIVFTAGKVNLVSTLGGKSK